MKNFLLATTLFFAVNFRSFGQQEPGKERCQELADLCIEVADEIGNQKQIHDDKLAAIEQKFGDIIAAKQQVVDFSQSLLTQAQSALDEIKLAALTHVGLCGGLEDPIRIGLCQLAVIQFYGPKIQAANSKVDAAKTVLAEAQKSLHESEDERVVARGEEFKRWGKIDDGLHKDLTTCERKYKDCLKALMEHQRLASEIGEEESIHIEAYPNPAHGHLVVKYSSDWIGPMMFHIYSSAGQMIENLSTQTSSEETGTIDLDITSLTPGIYVLEALNAKQASRTKFTVQ